MHSISLLILLVITFPFLCSLTLASIFETLRFACDASARKFLTKPAFDAAFRQIVVICLQESIEAKLETFEKILNNNVTGPFSPRHFYHMVFICKDKKDDSMQCLPDASFSKIMFYETQDIKIWLKAVGNAVEKLGESKVTNFTDSYWKRLVKMGLNQYIMDRFLNIVAYTYTQLVQDSNNRYPDFQVLNTCRRFFATQATLLSLGNRSKLLTGIPKPTLRILKNVVETSLRGRLESKATFKDEKMSTSDSVSNIKRMIGKSFNTVISNQNVLFLVKNHLEGADVANKYGYLPRSPQGDQPPNNCFYFVLWRGWIMLGKKGLNSGYVEGIIYACLPYDKLGEMERQIREFGKTIQQYGLQLQSNQIIECYKELFLESNYKLKGHGTKYGIITI